MTIEELQAKVIAALPDSVNGRPDDACDIIGFTARCLGFSVDEATGQLVHITPAKWKSPQQQNVRFRGQRGRR